MWTPFLFLMAFPAFAIGDATPVCDVIGNFMALPGCSCVDSGSGTGGIATCTQSIPTPPITLPAMSLGTITLFEGGELPQVTVQIGTEIKPCALPARAELHALITIPAGIPNQIVVMINELVQSNTDAGWSVEGSETEGLTLRIDQSAEAGNALDVDIPFFVMGIDGAQFYTTVRITMTVNMNAGSLSVASALDACLRVNFNQVGFVVEEEYCGGTLPTCDPEINCFNPMEIWSWPGPWCCATGQMNLNQLMGSPPFEIFKMTKDFTDICNAAGPDPTDDNQPPNPYKPAQSTADEGMDGGAIAGLVIGLLILFGIIVYAIVNRNKLPCVNNKTQLNEVTELGIGNR